MLKWFTNAVSDHEGESLAINSTHVINVYERTKTIAKEEGNVDVKTTFIFCGAAGTWEVKESIEIVVARLNEKD